jgi:hypothetical protein
MVVETLTSTWGLFRLTASVFQHRGGHFFFDFE